MAENDDIEGRRDIWALFAEITALLEDAHEIAVVRMRSWSERGKLRPLNSWRPWSGECNP